MATAGEFISFDGNSIGPATDYSAGLLDDAGFTTTGEITMAARRSLDPLVVAVSSNARTLPIVIYRTPGAATSLATFRDNVAKWFAVAKNTTPRYLVVYANDGSTAIRLPCYVQSMAQHRWGFLVTLVAAASQFEANSATTSSANPATVTNGGNVAVRPSIALTQSTHKTIRACTVSGAGAANGLVAYPIRFALSDSAATATNVFVFVNGVSVPCNVQGGGGASSVVWALVDTRADGSDTYVDIIYGSGITNPLCGELDDPDLFDTASTSNTSWRWDNWAVTTHPSFAGSWVPAVTGNHGASIAYQLTSDGGSVQLDIVASGTSDYDSIYLATPAGGDNGGSTGPSNLSRVTTGMGGAYTQAYVRGRLANTDRWTSGWSTRANGTVTTAATVSGQAIALAVGIENDGATADPATLVIDNTASPTSLSVDNASPTVTVGAAANVDFYTGTLTVGAYVLTFANCFAPDGTLTIDCQNKTISSSVAGAIYNLPSFSDPAVWAALEPGSNSVTDGLTATAADTWTWRDGYGA